MIFTKAHVCRIALVVLLALGGPLAAASADEQASALNRANGGTVGIIAGGVDGTYIRIAADLTAVLDDGNRLRIIPVIGKGSLQNLADILYLRGIDIGIVQSDVLAYAKRKELYPGIEQSIQYITKLYDEEIHILARPGINALADLANEVVNVDVRGSGTSMTASNLFDGLKIPVRVANDDQNTALEKLKRGEIAALVYVSGKPARLFAGLTGDGGLHFLPIPADAALLETYIPAQLAHSDYPVLIGEDGPVETIAVGSVMATFAWQPNQERYKKVARFVDALFNNFQQFMQPPRHPKWKDVNLAAQVPGWTRFAPAQDWLQRQATPDAASANLQSRFDTYLSQVSSPGSALTRAQKDNLFREFVSWQNSRTRPQ